MPNTPNDHYCFKIFPEEPVNLSHLRSAYATGLIAECVYFERRYGKTDGYNKFIESLINQFKNKTMSRTLAINKLKPYKTTYTDAVSIKWTNKRTTVIKTDDNRFSIEMRDASNADLSPRGTHSVLKGKVVVSSFRLSEDGAEALLFALAEMLNFQTIDK